MSDIVERLCRTLSDLPGTDDDLFNEIHSQREEAAKEMMAYIDGSSQNMPKPAENAPV